MKRKYELPQFLKGLVHERQYRRWLLHKSVAHVRRDSKRGNESATVAAYQTAIHQAVVNSGGVDVYTGRPLRWDLISTWRNEDSKAGGREYQERFGELPTVDHVGDGKGEPEFRICSWRTNRAKSDMTYEEFVSLCQSVLAHKNGQNGAEAQR